jgi:hypothetical protein
LAQGTLRASPIYQQEPLKAKVFSGLAVCRREEFFCTSASLLPVIGPTTCQNEWLFAKIPHLGLYLAKNNAQITTWAATMGKKVGC